MEYRRILKKKEDETLEFVEKIIDVEKKINSFSPKVPIQTNTYDCGIYVLAYVELFFMNDDFIMTRLEENVIKFIKKGFGL